MHSASQLSEDIAVAVAGDRQRVDREHLIASRGQRRHPVWGMTEVREFGIDESDGAPDEKESRPKQQPPGYQACMMAR